MNGQLLTLLQDSLAHYRGRQLKKALNMARIALDFGQKEGAEKLGLINANMLLARIYNTNGKYQNEPAFFQKALFYLSEARRLNELCCDQVAQMDILLIGGIISLNLKDHQKAISSFSKALELAVPLSDDHRVIKAKTLLCRYYTEIGKTDQAISTGEEVLSYFKQHIKRNHLSLLCEIHLQLSQAYIKKQAYSSSLVMSQELLRLSRETGDREKEVIALRNMAVVCGVKSNYKIGMQYFLEALDKCESIGYRDLYVQLQVNIGTLYAHLFNYTDSEKRYRDVLDHHRDVLDEKTKVIVYNNLGNIYINTGDPERAMDYFQRAYVIAEAGQFHKMLVHSLAQLSRSRLALNLLTEAKQDAEWAAQLIERLGQVNGTQINLLNQAEIAFREKYFDRALKLGEKALSRARERSDDACESRGLKLLAKIYKAQKNYAQALACEEKYGEIQEAFAKVQLQRQVLSMEIRYSIREKQKAIEQLTRENEFQSLLLKKSDHIASQNRDLKRANDELMQFAYAASHDLKEPLRMIGSYTGLLKKRIGDQIGDPELTYFDYIGEGVIRMNELLESLLKYATIGSNDSEKKMVDLNAVLNICQANLGSRIRQKEAELSFDQLPVVQGEKTLLTLLFQNLLANALKFVETHQRPVIHVSSYETENEWVIFMKDNGIGIEQQHLEKIFRIFHRLNARESYEGTGIGLAICQKIAERLKGRIWAESDPGKGSVFYIAVPK